MSRVYEFVGTNQRRIFGAVRAENRPWLAEQLIKVTLGAAQYKLNLLSSLEHAADMKHKEDNWLVDAVNQEFWKD